MAFYSRIPLVIAAIIIPTFYANMDAHKWIACSAAILLLVLIAIWVSIFSWKKPEHLLYGAETHFEKWKVEHKEPGSGQSLASRGLEDIPERIIGNE